MWKWARYHDDGYEVSSSGNTAYSPLFAKLADGRTIEEAYQLDVKGYRDRGSHWILGKGRPSLRREVNLWLEYLALWRQWADENPHLLAELAEKAKSTVLTDRHATRAVSTKPAHWPCYLTRDTHVEYHKPAKAVRT